MNKLLAVLILSCFSLMVSAADTQQKTKPVQTKQRVPGPVAEPPNAPTIGKTPAPIAEKEPTKPRIPAPVAEPAKAPTPAPAATSTVKTEKKTPTTQKKVNSQK